MVGRIAGLGSYGTLVPKVSRWFGCAQGCLEAIDYPPTCFVDQKSVTKICPTLSQVPAALPFPNEPEALRS